VHIDIEIMKTITVDENAHKILLWAKEHCHKEGIEKPNHSDAIRWMRSKILDKSYN